MCKIFSRIRFSCNGASQWTFHCYYDHQFMRKRHVARWTDKEMQVWNLVEYSYIYCVLHPIGTISAMNSGSTFIRNVYYFGDANFFLFNLTYEIYTLLSQMSLISQCSLKKKTEFWYVASEDMRTRRTLLKTPWTCMLYFDILIKLWRPAWKMLYYKINVTTRFNLFLLKKWRVLLSTSTTEKLTFFQRYSFNL